MATKPKDHTKTIDTIKKTVGELKKNLNKVTKGHEKIAAEKEKVSSPEDHKAALDHFASQYKMAMMNKDEEKAKEYAKSYHEYAAKLDKHYHSKLKESVDICPECMEEPCACGGNHLGEQMNPYQDDEQIDEGTSAAVRMQRALNKVQDARKRQERLAAPYVKSVMGKKEEKKKEVSEASYNVRKDPTYQKYDPQTHTMMFKDGKHKVVKHDQVAKHKAQGYKVRSSVKAFIKGQGMSEAKADPTSSWVVHDGDKVKRFKTHKGATAHAQKHGGKVASSAHYADKIQGKQGVAKGNAPIDHDWYRKQQERQTRAKQKQGVTEAKKQELMVGSKVTHPEHGQGTVAMHSPGGGNMGTVVKFESGKKVKVDHKKLRLAEQEVMEGSEQSFKVTYDVHGSNKEKPLYTNSKTIRAGSEQEAISRLRKLVGGTNHRVEKQGVAEAAGTKPGWMLKQDPALAKKIADAKKLAKVRKASYGDPSKGVSVKEGKMGERAAGDIDFNPEVKQSETPFDGPYKKSKGTVTDKSGAKHSALSRVRHLARHGAKKNVKEGTDYEKQIIAGYKAKYKPEDVKKDLEKTKKEYESRHGDIEKQGHEHADNRGYHHGKDLMTKYNNLKSIHKMITSD